LDGQCATSVGDDHRLKINILICYIYTYSRHDIQYRDLNSDSE
jgi:hypothetical protein